MEAGRGGTGSVDEVGDGDRGDGFGDGEGSEKIQPYMPIGIGRTSSLGQASSLGRTGSSFSKSVAGIEAMSLEDRCGMLAAVNASLIQHVHKCGWQEQVINVHLQPCRHYSIPSTRRGTVYVIHPMASPSTDIFPHHFPFPCSGRSCRVHRSENGTGRGMVGGRGLAQRSCSEGNC